MNPIKWPTNLIYLLFFLLFSTPLPPSLMLLPPLPICLSTGKRCVRRWGLCIRRLQQSNEGNVWLTHISMVTPLFFSPSFPSLSVPPLAWRHSLSYSYSLNSEYITHAAPSLLFLLLPLTGWRKVQRRGKRGRRWREVGASKFPLLLLASKNFAICKYFQLVAVALLNFASIFLGLLKRKSDVEKRGTICSLI